MMMLPTQADVLGLSVKFLLFGGGHIVLQFLILSIFLLYHLLLYLYTCFTSPFFSSSFPILSFFSSYKFTCSLLVFLDFTFSSSLFILFFSLDLLLVPIGFLHFFSLFFISTLLFLSFFMISFLRGFCDFLDILSPWRSTNSVDRHSWLITFFLILGLFY